MGNSHFLGMSSFFPASVTKLFILLILVGGFCAFDVGPWCEHHYLPVYACVFGWCRGKNMCYEMAKFANKHTDRLHWRKLFRLLIDFLAIWYDIFKPFSFRYRFATFFSHIFAAHFFPEFRCAITMWSHFGKNLPIEHGDALALAGSLSLHCILCDRGDFWHKMIDTFVKISSTNSMYRKDTVENLLYILSQSRESFRQQTECENRSAYYSNTSVLKIITTSLGAKRTVFTVQYNECVCVSLVEIFYVVVFSFIPILALSLMRGSMRTKRTVHGAIALAAHSHT